MDKLVKENVYVDTDRQYPATEENIFYSLYKVASAGEALLLQLLIEKNIEIEILRNQIKILAKNGK